MELRKSIPKIEPPFKVYIYCTKAKFRAEDYAKMSGMRKFHFERWSGKVIGEFTCTGFLHNCQMANADIAEFSSLVRREKIFEYSNGKPVYGWRISNLIGYDEPKNLYEFYKHGAPTIEELDEQLCNYCIRTDYGEKRSCSTPDGYWSCEGAWCEEAYTEYLDTKFVLTRPPQSWVYVEG